MNSQSHPRPLFFGEVLFDRFPDGSEVLGGAPFNVAWHLQAFGGNPLFVSRVGNDALGRKIRGAMQDWGMDTAGLQMDSTYPTGTVKVGLVNGEPSFDIETDRAYDRIDADSLPPLEPNALVYHGSLALRSKVSRAALTRIKERLAPKTFVDVNLRPPWWKKMQVLALIESASWVKINRDELAALVDDSNDHQDQASILQERYGLDILYVTEGAAGAYARTPEGQIRRVTPRLNVQVVDAVGAGDAFASVLILGLLRDWPLQQSLDRAQDFASAMVGQRGATVHDPHFYQRYIDNWDITGG